MSDHWRQPWHDVTRIAMIEEHNLNIVSEIVFDDNQSWIDVTYRIRSWLLLVEYTLQHTQLVLFSNLGRDRTTLEQMTPPMISTLLNFQDVRLFRVPP